MSDPEPLSIDKLEKLAEAEKVEVEEIFKRLLKREEEILRGQLRRLDSHISNIDPSTQKAYGGHVHPYIAAKYLSE